MKQKVISFTELKGIPLFKRGKVRDVYDLGDSLLIVSTDRISCFDVVLPALIPQKGQVLNALSVFWFNFIQGIIQNHLITTDISQFPDALMKYQEELTGRSMLVKKTRPLPIECVVRGYLSGSGWKEYKQKQSICGISLPRGLRESDKLPECIFTPATKEDKGHDINVSQEHIEQQVGKDLTRKLKDTSIKIYKKASEYAQTKGIIIADTKFEFGLYNDQLILIDEALTPDSSRFWPKEHYQPGMPQPSFDKQFVRDYLQTLDWDKTPPAPDLPQDIIEKTSQKYIQAYAMLVGKAL